jgi:putative Mn2+ efflux pump MntP
MNRTFQVGGYVSSAILVLLGIAMIVVGFVGRSDVRDRLAQEKIVGTPDSSIAGQQVDTGSEAQTFADTIRKHTLEATGGLSYAEMPRAVFKDSGEAVPEDQVDQALASGKAIDNPERQIWITSTALSTALNTSFFAESVATFAIVVGIALILIGIGLFLLARGVVGRPASAKAPAAAPASATGA